jgi:hypothetical protein
MPALRGIALRSILFVDELSIWKTAILPLSNAPKSWDLHYPAILLPQSHYQLATNTDSWSRRQPVYVANVVCLCIYLVILVPLNTVVTIL